MLNSDTVTVLNPPSQRGRVALTTSGPVAVINADFDGDGTLDLALLDLSSGRVTVWSGDQESGFRLAGGTEQRAGEHLSRREREVAVLLGSGYTDREIASRLGIGRRTAESHAASVRAKLGLKSRRELIRKSWTAA